MASTDHIAQTNTQLYRQLQGAGYSETTLESICKAYECTLVLFNCHYGMSGKPFVCHLVGTASVLASLGVSSEYVIAGLLHAAYETKLRMESRLISNHILKTFGKDVDVLISSYTRFSWDEYSIMQISQDLGTLSEIQKKTVLMRLANEVDNYLDLGPHYAKHAGEKIERLEKFGPIFLDLAERLNYPILATYIQDTLTRTLDTPTPPDQLKRKVEISFDSLPPSIILHFLFRPLIKFLRHKVSKNFMARTKANSADC